MSEEYRPLTWRETEVESNDIYPGLTVYESRVGGSITAGPTRLPLWCLIADLVDGGIKEVERSYDLKRTGLTGDDLSGFLYHLLEQRGEFGRLLCVLADVERLADERYQKSNTPGETTPWWNDAESVDRVKEQLRLCLQRLEKFEK